VVSEVCARGYGAGNAREGRTSKAERVVGRSAAGAAVAVEKEISLSLPREWMQRGVRGHETVRENEGLTGVTNTAIMEA